MSDLRARNYALARSLWLPSIFLTVALLGGLRVDAETRDILFLPPPLIALLLAVLLMTLFVRGQLILIPRWFSADSPALTNISHALTFLTLFFASAQALHSVLPESGLLHWMFSFFFLWTLWNNLFSAFDARRLLRSLAVLFGTAFVLKHLLLASLYAPTGGLLRRLTGVLVEGLALGTLDPQAFAPATGYLSFFTLALYVGGLILTLPAFGPVEPSAASEQLLEAYDQLPPAERARVRRVLRREELSAANEEPLPPPDAEEAARPKLASEKN